MARKKTPPEREQTKYLLAQRLKAVRVELFGERGGPELAGLLGLPARTWYNYEVGVTVPSEVLLRFIELTSVEPKWLLSGDGEKYRNTKSQHRDESPSSENRDPDAPPDRASEWAGKYHFVIKVTWRKSQ
jgi:hypothetical protein